MEKLRELSLFGHKQRRRRGDLIIRLWCLKGGYKEDGDSLSYEESHGKYEG